MMLSIVIILISSFIAYPIVLGLMNIVDFEFSLSVKNFRSPYYVIGLSFVEHDTVDDEYIEQEFMISLYVISLTFIFYKRTEDA